MAKADIAMVGLGVMGQNLALNMESKGFAVVGYDYLPDKTDKFIAQRAAGKNITGVRSLEELVRALASPRKIMMMVPAGKAVDELIESLTPRLEPGDILIDGGNSYFKDTIRRTKDSRVQGPALHRHRGFRRRRGRADRPEHNAREGPPTHGPT